MKYIIKTALRTRGPVDHGPDRAIEGLFLVGEKRIAEWEEGQTPYGGDFIEIFPAVKDGERAFLEKRTWSPAWGYRAQGTEETILPFGAGVNLLITHDAFAWIFPARGEGGGHDEDGD